MIATHELKRRDLYLSKIVGFKDTEPVKVVTGIRRRELAPLQKINDNYEKIVLSLEPGLDASYDGIKSLSLINWLL